MKKIGVFLAVIVLAGLMNSEAYGGYSRKFHSDEITGIDLKSVENLFHLAMDHKSGDKIIHGDQKAQYELGVLYFAMFEATHMNSDISAPLARYNLTQAVHWLGRAAGSNLSSGNYAPAQYLLGQIYYWYFPFIGERKELTDEAIREAHEEAMKLLDMAVENGYARAQAQKADILHLSGHNAEALELAERSAKQGDTLGMFVLSLIYGDEGYEGYDKAKSEEWKKKAMEAAKNDPTIDFDD